MYLRFPISNLRFAVLSVALCLCGSLFVSPAAAVEFQPLAANATRLLVSLDLLGAPLDKEHVRRIRTAMENINAAALEKELNSVAALTVTIDDQQKITTTRGEAPLVLQQAAYVPLIVKLVSSN